MVPEWRADFIYLISCELVASVQVAAKNKTRRAVEGGHQIRH